MGYYTRILFSIPITHLFSPAEEDVRRLAASSVPPSRDAHRLRSDLWVAHRSQRVSRAAQAVLDRPEASRAWPDKAVGSWLRAVAQDAEEFMVGDQLLWSCHVSRGGGLSQGSPYEAPEHEIAWLGELVQALWKEGLLEQDERGLLMLQGEAEDNTVVVEFRLHPWDDYLDKLPPGTPRTVRARQTILHAGWSSPCNARTDEPQDDDVAGPTTFDGYVSD